MLINDSISPETGLVVAPVDHFPGVALNLDQISLILELVLDKIGIMAGRLIYYKLY